MTIKKLCERTVVVGSVESIVEIEASFENREK